MANRDAGARVIARLDEEEQAMLRRIREATGKNTSAVIKEALRAYARTLPKEGPLEIFARCGVVGSISGPTDLSETYKAHIDYAEKHENR